MRLKSLKLAGFKSFANLTTFTFKHGITAIVGPNGCGKSNVIDAIRWVLGESSAKQLRGGAMSDVIFAGTQDKSAKSLASVELTFEHTQDEQTGIRHELNLYHELSVRRQVNIEGKSDYFINGTRCRRRDVVDVFLGTGLGPRSYSVIQQGMIGRIVDSSPIQLREFIEEAAGVSRYQARREETQKKLAKTRENLDRLTDIEAELTRQKKKLSRQAQSASAYQQVLDDLNQAKEQLAVHQLYQAKSAQLQYQKSQQALNTTLQTLQQSSDKLKTKLSKLNERMAEEQWLKDEARDVLHEQDMQRQQAEHKLATAQTNLEQLEARLQANKHRQDQTKQEVSQLQQQLQTHEQTLAILTPKLAQIKQQQQSTQAKLKPMQVDWQACVAKVTELEASKHNYEQQLALGEHAQKRLQNDLGKWQTRDNQWQLEAKKWQLPVADISTEANSNPVHDEETADKHNLVAIDGQIKALEAELSSIDNQRDDIEYRLEVERPALTALQKTLTDNQNKLASLEKQHASLLGEYDTLHSIVYRPKKNKAVSESDQHNTQQISSNLQNGNVPEQISQKLGQLLTLHDSIELTKTGKQYAKTLDMWLAFWLDSRVCSGNTAADNQLSHWSGLLNELSGFDLSTLLKKPENKNKKNGGSKKDTASKNEVANSVFLGTNSWQSSSVMPERFNQVKPLSELIVTPKLAIFEQCYLYIADDADLISNEIDNADLSKLLESLAKPAILLTTTGWLITTNMAIHLSKLMGEGQNQQFLSERVAQQERLAILEDKLNELEESMQALSKTVKANTAELEQLTVVNEELVAQLNALTHRQHEYKQQHIKLSAKREEWQREHTRLQGQRRQLDIELKELQQEQQDLQQKEVESRELLAKLLPRLEQAQQQKDKLETLRQQITEQERADNEAYSQIQLEMNKSELAFKHSSEKLTQLTGELERLAKTHQKLTVDGDKAQLELPKLQQAVKAAADICYQQKIALDERNAVIDALKADINKLQGEQNIAERNLQQVQQKLAECTTQVAIADERIHEASERLIALDDSANPAAILSEFMANPYEITEEAIRQLQEEEKTLTEELNNIGPVNLAAAAELASVDERLLPLEQQISDITASMTTLVDAIESIDAKTKTLFMSTLNTVNESLTNLFTKVFGGGQASLTLIKDDTLAKAEKWRAGLELMAQPKGKKNSRLAVLSGGEKTLTALSLIFAIFKQHPAPFCVLDEVDAPLDDANVARFTNLIGDLADDVQFIFISHNKLAMQIADELKGITMPQAGISTLVSVSLEEAEQYLEPNA